MFVIPAPGMKVPDPAMQGTPDYFLPPQGRSVQPSDYWHRRVRDRDVTLGQPPADQVVHTEADPAA